MLEGNRCELCGETIQGARAIHKQTKYCEECAKIKKKQNTLNPWLPEEQRMYMRSYMRKYRRAHPKLSTPYVRKHRAKEKEKQASSKGAHETHPTPQAGSYFSLPLGVFPLLWLIGLQPEGANLSFESIRTAITHLNIIVVEVTGLGVVISFCVKHLVDLWRRKR